MDSPALSVALTNAPLRSAGVNRDEWLCAVCGAVVADELVRDPRPPVHEHYGHAVEFVERPQPAARMRRTNPTARAAVLRRRVGPWRLERGDA